MAALANIAIGGNMDNLIDFLDVGMWVGGNMYFFIDNKIIPCVLFANIVMMYIVFVLTIKAKPK
jgi:hypothetical protein